MDALLRLDGQVAIVTGATGGLGSRIAQTLAEAGAKVALFGRRAERLRELADGIGPAALPLAVDLDKSADIAPAVAEVEAKLGPVGILINSAGVNIRKPLLELDEAEWDRILDTNLKATFLVAQAVARRMVAHGNGGRIVNISSMLAERLIKTVGPYAASKAAVVTLTKAMALEWAAEMINVNAILPGYIETDLNRAFLHSERGQAMRAKFERPRVGEPRDLDGLVLYLCSPAARFVTGGSFLIDDGQSLAI